MGERDLRDARERHRADLWRQFTNSGYQQQVRGLAPGIYKLGVRARSTVTGTFNQVREVTLTVHANPQMWVDQPGTETSVNQTFTISGWAVDPAAAAARGERRAHLGVSESGLWAGAYLGGHADLWHRAVGHGVDLRQQFTNSGVSMTATLPPGAYYLYTGAYSRSPTHLIKRSTSVTVATSQPVMAIDTPGTGWWLSQPFMSAAGQSTSGRRAGPGSTRSTCTRLPMAGRERGRSLGRRHMAGRGPTWGRITGASSRIAPTG